MTVLQDLPEERPESAEAADAQIEAVETAVEQGITAEKVFATIDPEGGSLASLAWGQDLPRLQERLDGALSSAQSELDSLKSTRNVLLTREREEKARQEEEARQAELERKRQEAARQAEAQRQREQAARAEAERRAAEDRRRAEESAKAEESESATPTPSATPSSSPPPSSESASPEDSDSSGDDD